MKSRQAWCSAVALMVAACAAPSADEKKEPESESRPRLVGRITSVPARGGFVLIESYGPWRVPEAGVLSTAGPEGSSANLVVSGEKLGAFAAADIRSGTVKIGDSVYFRPINDGNSEEETVASGVPSTARPTGESKTNVPQMPASQ